MWRYFYAGVLMVSLTFACGKTERHQGANLYIEHCANCHMENGKGLRQLIPPLNGADFLQHNQAQAVHAIRYGMEGPIMVNNILYNEAMPGNKDLTEFQIVNIMNYINNAWGNDYGTITVEQTRQWLNE